MGKGRLDPQDWDALHRAAQELLAQALARLAAAGEGPVWQPLPAPMRDALRGPMPESPSPPEAVAARLAALLPHGVGNTHPRFYGWVHGAGTPGNILAEIAAAAMNANLGGRDHGAIHVERQLLSWCRDLTGFPAGSGGLITTGSSMATLVALKVARDRALGAQARARGTGGAALTGYASEQAHGCIGRAFDMLGLGTDALRPIPVDGQLRMDIAALGRAIDADRAAGRIPFAVIGTAGTVNTGAIDDLAAIGRLARAERLWFHLDAAFGAALFLSDRLRPRLDGVDLADSIAFDFHKWFQVNYSAGCVLVRDGAAHRRAFADRPDYLQDSDSGLAGGAPWPVDFGPELSRDFRALKVWVQFVEHGRRRLAQVVEDNIAQARWLALQVAADPAMELLAPAPLNIVCFRMVRPGIADLDRWNRAIVTALQMRGLAAPSTTRLGGRLAIRVNLTNHRTGRDDLAALLADCRRIADELADAGGS